MTDAQMVEKVAREVMGWNRAPASHWWIINPKDIVSKYRYRTFYPLTDANDLQLVKDKLREMGWEVTIHINFDGCATVYIGKIIDFETVQQHIISADTEVRAICEAAIKAVEGGEK